MAYFRCSNGGGSSELTETLLWENPSPTNTWSGDYAQVSSDKYTNYKYLRFEYKNHRGSSATEANLVKVMCALEDLQKGAAGSGTNGASPFAYYNGGYYVRGTIYYSDTKIYIYSAYRIGTTSTANDYMIPYRIYGLK